MITTLATSAVVNHAAYRYTAVRTRQVSVRLQAANPRTAPQSFTPWVAYTEQ